MLFLNEGKRVIKQVIKQLTILWRKIWEEKLLCALICTGNKGTLQYKNVTSLKPTKLALTQFQNKKRLLTEQHFDENESLCHVHLRYY